MTEASRSSEQRTWWTITVTSYGSFAYYGTEREADEVRKAKAEWEGGRGTKRKATDAEIAEEVKHLGWKRDNDYPLTTRELEALK